MTSLGSSPDSVASRRKWLQIRGLPNESNTGVLEVARGCPPERSSEIRVLPAVGREVVRNAG